MGSHQSSVETFNQANWREVSSPFSEVIQYQNIKDHNFHIERHRIQTISKDEFDRIREISFIRKHNPRWVAAVYFQEEEPDQTEFCASKYQASLFLEKIPIRLCDLRNIPFPDILHLYDQALNGFYELARVVGCFPVECDYIGVNERGVVKVWAGSKWSHITVKGGSVSQEDMVRGIVECLQECIDKTSMPPQNPSVRNFLYRTADRIGFEQAIAELRNFSKTTSQTGTPTRLHSLEDNPGRYDTDRERVEQSYMNGQRGTNHYNSRSSSQVPNHFSPRFSMQREQGLQEQITTFRRVDSVSNETMQRQQAVSNFAAPRPPSNQPSQLRMERSLSNAQLPSPAQLKPNSSYKQLEPMPVISSYPSSHRVSINSQFSQQAISPPPFQVHYQTLQANLTPVPIYYQQDTRLMSVPSEQKQSQYISTKPEFVTDPPSSAGLPIHPTLHQQISQNSEHSPLLLRPNYSNPGQPSPKLNKITSRNTTEGQSIIMQLYASQDNAALNPNAPIKQTKKFGVIRRSESYHVDLRKFDSATVINESLPGSMRGIPHGQVKYLTPSHPNRNQLSNLNSIEEVHTENNWKENGSRNTSTIKNSGTAEHESLKQLDNGHTQPSSIIFNKSNHPVIDQNDGKSSEDFLRKLKEFGNNNSFFAGETLQSMPITSNSRINEKKKSVGFTNTLDVVEFDAENSLGRLKGKKESYLNDYYDARLFPFASEGHPGIDPVIWADLQRQQQ